MLPQSVILDGVHLYFEHEGSGMPSVLSCARDVTLTKR